MTLSILMSTLFSAAQSTRLLTLLQSVQCGLFGSAPATGLALARVAFYGGLFVIYLPRGLARYGDFAPSLWQPHWPWTLLGNGPLPGLEAVVQPLFLLSLLLTCLGILTRISAPLALLSGFFALGYPNQIGRAFHNDAPVVMILAVCAFAHLGHGWSVDNWLSKWIYRGQLRLVPWLPQPGPQKNRMKSGEYKWPITSARVVLCCVFFAAGLSKLLNSGLEWVFSDHLALVLEKQVVRSDPWTSFGYVIAGHPLLARLLAGSVLLFEMAYPWALFLKRLRPFIVVGALLMLLSIKLFLGPAFLALAWCQLWWLPWERWGSRIAGSSNDCSTPTAKSPAES